jgi:hypothetical protein
MELGNANHSRMGEKINTTRVYAYKITSGKKFT